MSTPSPMHKQADASRIEYAIGRLEAWFAALDQRAGEADRRLESMDRNLVTMVESFQRTELRNVILASLCGAFSGCVAGLATAALMMHYAVTNGWIGG